MKFASVMCIVAALTVPSLWAQSPTPSADQMVEQLKAPRTRSMRNLTVEAAPQPKPSLSLLIQFDFNSARVKPESLQALSNLTTAMQSDALRDARFAIEGHTDAKGSAQQNITLSQHRAQAVKDVLVANGVDGQRLQTAGKGFSELADPDHPMAAENRRVRIVNME